AAGREWRLGVWWSVCGESGGVPVGEELRAVDDEMSCVFLTMPYGSGSRVCCRVFRHVCHHQFVMWIVVNKPLSLYVCDRLIEESRP
ncbi:hypothetical protein RB213_009085, partial [Colletotrichum asianum]